MGALSALGMREKMTCFLPCHNSKWVIQTFIQLSVHLPVHPSIFYRISEIRSRGQQPTQRGPEFSLPSYFVQLFGGGSRAVPRPAERHSLPNMGLPWGPLPERRALNVLPGGAQAILPGSSQCGGAVCVCLCVCVCIARSHICWIHLPVSLAFHWQATFGERRSDCDSTFISRLDQASWSSLLLVIVNV